jgi:branched-chain amino acid transport system substrate-binding protein
LPRLRIVQPGICPRRQAASLKNVELDLLLPGLAIITSRADYRVIKQFRMMRFTGERWEPFGPIVAD